MEKKIITGLVILGLLTVLFSLYIEAQGGAGVTDLLGMAQDPEGALFKIAMQQMCKSEENAKLCESMQLWEQLKPQNTASGKGTEPVGKEPTQLNNEDGTLQGRVKAGENGASEENEFEDVSQLVNSDFEEGETPVAEIGPDSELNCPEGEEQCTFKGGKFKYKGQEYDLGEEGTFKINKETGDVIEAGPIDTEGETDVTALVCSSSAECPEGTKITAPNGVKELRVIDGKASFELGKDQELKIEGEPPQHIKGFEGNMKYDQETGKIEEINGKSTAPEGTDIIVEDQEGKHIQMNVPKGGEYSYNKEDGFFELTGANKEFTYQPVDKDGKPSGTSMKVKPIVEETDEQEGGRPGQGKVTITPTEEGPIVQVPEGNKAEIDEKYSLESWGTGKGTLQKNLDGSYTLKSQTDGRSTTTRLWVPGKEGKTWTGARGEEVGLRGSITTKRKGGDVMYCPPGTCEEATGSKVLTSDDYEGWDARDFGAGMELKRDDTITDLDGMRAKIEPGKITLGENEKLSSPIGDYHRKPVGDNPYSPGTVTWHAAEEYNNQFGEYPDKATVVDYTNQIMDCNNLDDDAASGLKATDQIIIPSYGGGEATVETPVAEYTVKEGVALTNARGIHKSLQGEESEPTTVTYDSWNYAYQHTDDPNSGTVRVTRCIGAFGGGRSGGGGAGRGFVVGVDSVTGAGVVGCEGDCLGYAPIDNPSGEFDKWARGEGVQIHDNINTKYFEENPVELEGYQKGENYYVGDVQAVDTVIVKDSYSGKEERRLQFILVDPQTGKEEYYQTSVYTYRRGEEHKQYLARIDPTTGKEIYKSSFKDVDITKLYEAQMKIEDDTREAFVETQPGVLQRAFEYVTGVELPRYKIAGQ